MSSYEAMVELVETLRARGFTRAEISERLGLSPRQVKYVVETFLRKKPDPEIRTRKKRTSTPPKPERRTCIFTLTPPAEVVESAGGVDRFVAEFVSRVPVPGWKATRVVEEFAVDHALITARAAARGRGSDVVIFATDPLVVAELPSHATGLGLDALRREAYYVIPIALTPA